MADRDPAFLWESEALRSGPRPTRTRSGGVLLDGGDWLTLREASEATGVPAATIRKWARHDNIPSFLEETAEGHLRMVSVSGILRWAEEIGRELELEDMESGPAPGEPETQIDLTAEESGDDAAESGAPEGSMLVPLDAWNKMLNQLGNLHEAGQQLAEARERAAKAETEAHFLKERLGELRAELELARQAPEHSGPSGTGPQAENNPPPTVSTTLGGTAANLVRNIYQGWRERRRSG